MMTKTMAQEAAPFGVRALALAPGAIQTDINRAVWSDPGQLKDLLGKIPLGRMGQVQDIAGLVTVLASDAGAYVTGTTVFVDGGMTDYPEFAHGVKRDALDLMTLEHFTVLFAGQQQINLRFPEFL